MTMTPFSGVSRVLDPTAREFREVILQQGKPPMDAEFNLLQEMALDVARRGVLSGMPSGWLGNETNLPADYQTNPAWSNWFKFGTQRAGEKQSVMYANVNGWLVPVTGTRTGTPPGSPNNLDTTNLIALDPPPANSGDQRADFVFLEVWQARVAPNPSTTNKPNSTSLYRYGNVEGGYDYLPDDLVDPSLGFETSQRIQLQYRVRVVKGPVGLANYPDGFDPSYVKGKGAYDPAHPDTQTSFTFQNMRQELGDPGLWRAGDGTQNNLGTADGYVYAIPLCAVFRRNTVEWLGEDSPNLNGAVNRNPSATDRTGVKTFTVTPTLASAMTLTSTTISLVAAAGSPLPASSLTPVYIQIGDEILTYQGITGNTLNNVQRGQAGTVAETHPAGAVVRILSSRPDGLFADQVALTDILDLRHVVNPNGFKYDTLLRYNFDKLLKGELRSNWKRSNGGTQGVFVNYQDMISQDTASLSVTQLDKSDGYRMIFSDAVTAQPFEAIVQPVLGTAPVDYTASWSLGLTVNRTFPATKASLDFAQGDQLTIEIGQLKNGLDSDQVRWCDENDFRVELRLEGDPSPINPLYYTVTPTGSALTTNDDLVITLGAPGYPFPTVTGRKLYIKVWALYGAGRGTARIADAVHSVTLRSPQSNILYRLPNYPANNYRTNTGFAPSWSRFAPVPPPGVRAPLPVTAESYVDPGSRTIILQPFQRISWPNTTLTQDGTAANVSVGPSGPVAVLTSTTGSTTGSTTFTDAGVDFTASLVTAGMALVITDSDTMLGGRYSVMAVVNSTTLTLDRPLLVTQSGIDYSIYSAQGLMPTKKRDGTTTKWTTTDPLGLFSGSTDVSHPTTKNMYVNLPAHLVPKAGEFHVPIRTVDAAPFSEGINFMFASGKGSTYADADRNVVPYLNGTVSYAVFSTLDLTPPYTNPAPYNGLFTVSGKPFAGMQKFTDTRGLGRQGLQLPPFYGISRLFGVYEASDYRVNQGPFNTTTRDRLTSGGAVNLLRQDVAGPTFWIEVDEDGDATFILNAECLDLSRSPNPIANFAAGQYVIEASIFGFDRDAFNDPPPAIGTREVRIVLTRYVSGSTAMRTQAADQTVGNRAANITASINGPVSVLPGPLGLGDTALYNYSRTPYGGDAWGTQRPNTDLDRLAGPLASGDAYQLATTKPDITNLTRPNEKAFEVLASLPFVTTAGTGRVAGPLNTMNPLQAAGYEDISSYPPASPLAARPNFYSDALGTYPTPYQSRYNGLIERLPLGALRRDQDFRASTVAPETPNHTVLGTPGMGVGGFSGMASQTNQEATNLIRLADGSVEPGNVIVHVDGSNFDAAAPFRNFRTNRGGSGYMANGDNPGGWVAPGVVGHMAPYSNQQVMLAGTAYLVRNTITNKGGNEVSAGDELMLLVATQYQPTYNSTLSSPAVVEFSTVGVGEGDAALDYYRIEGHPLVRDNVGAEIDPSTIQLAGP